MSFVVTLIVILYIALLFIGYKLFIVYGDVELIKGMIKFLEDDDRTEKAILLDKLRDSPSISRRSDLRKFGRWEKNFLNLLSDLTDKLSTETKSIISKELALKREYQELKSNEFKKEGKSC